MNGGLRRRLAPLDEEVDDAMVVTRESVLPRFPHFDLKFTGASTGNLRENVTECLTRFKILIYSIDVGGTLICRVCD